MKTIRILAVIFFLVFLILTAIGIYLIIKDSISLYSIADSLPYGFIRDIAIYLFNLFWFSAWAFENLHPQ